MFGAARARWKLSVAGLGIVLAILTALVAGGQLTSTDQYAVDHLMPGLRPSVGDSHESRGLRGLFLPFGSDTNWWSKVLDTWVYPCSVALSLIVVLVAFVVLWRRGRPVASLVWAGAWVVGNGIEVVGKDLITRPALYAVGDGGARIHVGAFDQAFPSGHSIRCVIIAGAVLFLWRRVSRAVLVWAALVLPALVFSAAHTPTDVAGGTLIGLMLLLVALAICDGAGPDSAIIRTWRR